MPAIPLGRYWRYDRADVLAWLNCATISVLRSRE
jgi:hypothetical protein